MFMPRNIKPQPMAAWTDFTPPGPWSNGQYVVRNADGVGFTYDATINTLTVNANKSASVKDANNFIIKNLPAPSLGGDAVNKTYADALGGGGGGIPEAPLDSFLYGRYNATWIKGLPLAGGTLLGPLTLAADPSTALGASTKQYVDTAVSGIAVPAPSSSTPGMDGAGAAGSATAYSRGDHIHPSDTSRAPLASPTFTGTPAAPTASPGTNTTQLATTAFVSAAVSGVTPPTPSSSTPAMDGTGAAGSATTYSRGDHVHPSDTTKAPLASPALTGTPTAPTPATADNSTTIATTAYVKAQGYLTANQTVTLSGDITGSGTTAIATTLATVNSNVGTFQGITVNGKGLVTAATNMNYAPLASPALTGSPTAPTVSPGTDNTTKIATTAFVQSALASIGVGGVTTPDHGGTGVANNAASTLTISGAFGTTLTVTAATSITLPTSGTLLSSVSTGTSGHKLPYLDTACSWTGDQTFTGQLICTAGKIWSYGYGGNNNLGALFLNSAGTAYVSFNVDMNYAAPGGVHKFYQHIQCLTGQVWSYGLGGTNANGIFYLGNSGSYYIYSNGSAHYYNAPGYHQFQNPIEVASNSGVSRFRGTSGSFIPCAFNMNSSANDYFQVLENNATSALSYLYYNGSNSVAWTTPSDIRLKSNIQPMPPELSAKLFDMLDPRQFIFVPTGTEAVGLLAQDVRLALPEAFVPGDETDERLGTRDFRPHSIIWDPFWPYVISEIKFMRARIKELESQLAGMRH